jgi:hypothetical protein
MMPDPSFRSFHGGAWDLRKRERRQSQDLIAFPDRRQSERRKTIPEEEFHSELKWLSKPGLDE